MFCKFLCIKSCYLVTFSGVTWKLGCDRLYPGMGLLCYLVVLVSDVTPTQLAVNNIGSYRIFRKCFRLVLQLVE